jgi:N-methylhydantoinase A
LQLSFDIGGTFTDVVLMDEGTGRLWLGKTLTTYGDLSRAVSEGIGALLAASGTPAAAVDRPVVGATTLVTNALIERRAPPAALIATRGFADVIEIGRELRYDIYDLRLQFPEPLVPRSLRFEVTERIRTDGSVETPLDHSDLEDLVRGLRESGVRSVAICLLNSYASDRHERQIAEHLQAHAPEVLVTLSSELSPEIREYERTVTAAANAYVRPVAGEHLRDVESALGQVGIDRPLRLMQSNGGITDTERGRRFPIALLESGPAAGAIGAASIGAAYWGRRLGISNLIAFDMGGTTAKICLIDDGQPSLTRSFEVARVARHKRGSGLEIRVPVVELLEIGAGGGSIADLNSVGLLTVGPESAGSEPGPACYGRGGERPTVTDANVVLGYLDPGYFLGGRMPLDLEAARRALATISEPFGGDVDAAASGVLSVVEESMAAAMRIHATERGRDPRAYAVFAFGGAAPVHAVSVARRLGIEHVIIPSAAGVLAATGLHVAPPAVDVARTQVMPLTVWDSDVVAGLCAELRERALPQLGALAGSRVTWSISADMRFRNQGFEIEVALPQLSALLAGERSADELEVAEVDHLFRDRYELLRGGIPPAAEAEVVTWRLTAIGEWSEPELAIRRPDLGAGSREEQSRRAWFSGIGFVSVPVLAHLTLAPGERRTGPAIVQQPESTVVIGPGDIMYADDDANLHVEVAPVTESS